MGINLWFAPQISEHWPKYSPGRWPINLSWLRRPGTASALTPREGTVQEWSTSAEDTRTRIWVNIGTTVRLSTSKRRNIPGSSSFVGTMYASNSRSHPSESHKSLYSYLQYHWCPMVFRVKEVSTLSSSMYSNNNDGRAIWSKIAAGTRVHTHSTICISSRSWLTNFL